MSIATEIERLQTAKADIKTAIEEKGVTVGDGLIDTSAEKIGKISGGDSVVKLMTNFDSAFYAKSYPKDTELTLEYGNYFTGGISQMLRYSNGIKSIKLIGNKDVTLNIGGAFANCQDLETIDLSECSTNITNIQYSFSGSSKLKTVKGIMNIKSGSAVVAAFSGCDNLVDVRFSLGCIEKDIDMYSSSLLSAESVQSIIDGLTDLTGGTAKTLRLHSAVGTSLTDEQKAVITAKNWTLVY